MKKIISVLKKIYSNSILIILYVCAMLLSGILGIINIFTDIAENKNTKEEHDDLPYFNKIAE